MPITGLSVPSGAGLSASGAATLDEPFSPFLLPATDAAPAPATGRSGAADYARLKGLVSRAGLLEKQPHAYLWRFITTGLGLALCGALLFLGKGVLFQLANGALLGVLYAQVGFLMHDAGHRQIFRSTAANNAVGFICANLLVGLSFSWWMDKHNRHHASPNQLDTDPDIDFPVLAFSEEQALSKRWPCRMIVRHQALYFFPLLLLQTFSLRGGSMAWLAQNRNRRPWLEWSLLVAHYSLYCGLVFGLLDLWPALAFIAASQAVSGIYSGSVFAPNHKGMPLLERGALTGFVEQQVMTSRNVRPGPLVDFLYGGLNYQIEHHLFPAMARHRLGELRSIVRQFCHDHGCAYHETGVIQAFREVVGHLHRVSAPLRRRGRRDRLERLEQMMALPEGESHERAELS